MSKPNDGGPAFARPIAQITRGDAAVITDDGAPGMSLRAYFAGRALPAVIAGQLELLKGGVANAEDSLEMVARMCVAFADILIAELEKETP